MPQVAFSINSFKAVQVRVTQESELYRAHSNICKMESLSPAEKGEALRMSAEKILV